MRKAIKIVEIAWLVVSGISAIEVVRLWGSHDQTFWIYVGAFFLGIFMFIFRRNQRKKMEARAAQKDQSS